MDDQATAAALRRVGGKDGVALEVVLDQRGGGHLAEHVLVTLDQHVLRLAGHPQAEVVVGHVVDAVVGEDAVPGGKLDARLPFGGARLQANRRSGCGGLRGHGSPPVRAGMVAGSASLPEPVSGSSQDQFTVQRVIRNTQSTMIITIAIRLVSQDSPSLPVGPKPRRAQAPTPRPARTPALPSPA